MMTSSYVLLLYTYMFHIKIPPEGEEGEKI